MSSSPELDKYVTEARQSGMSDDQIRSELLKAGWDLSNIDLGTNSVKPPIQRQTPPVYTPTEAKPFQPQTAEPAYNTAPIEQSPAKSSHRGFKTLAVLFILVLLGGGAGLGYAYLQKIGPFAEIPYTEKNLVSGLLNKLSEINTSLYTSSVSFDIVPREAGAEPFVIQVSNEGQLRQQYQNDYDRSKSVSALLQNFSYIKGKYPSTIQELGKGIPTYANYSITDPVSGNPYGYKLTDNGKNFALTVNFETDNAIKTIKKSSGFTASTTLISGKEITFTKDSYRYFYLNNEPPKPFLVSLGEYSRMLPPDISAMLSFSATSDSTKAGQSDWKFNLDGTGDFGDLTYAVNVDALGKDGIYYFKVNKIPSLFFLSSLAAIKGQWIKVDPSASSTLKSNVGYNEFSSISSELPKFEDSYKKNREETLNFIKKTASLADEENLFTFKNQPTRETVGDRSLYKYDLKIKKEAIVSFYQKILAEASKKKDSPIGQLSNDQGALEYLQSKEFGEVFDYLDKNTGVTIYVDMNGFPAILQYTMRIVPPDTALQLKDKQANLIFKLILSKINEPVDIEAPGESKPIQQVMEETMKNYNTP